MIKNNIKVKQLPYLYFAFVIIFIVCLLIANVIANRFFVIFGISLPSSVLIFPITFIIGDLITEIFGFRKCLYAILLGIAANLLFVLICLAVVNLPSPGGWALNSSFDEFFQLVPRVLVASFGGVLIGGISNSLIMVWLKKLTKTKYLWLRAIVSTIAGEILDTALFLIIAFTGIIPFNEILWIMLYQSIFKIAYEVIFLPVIYLVTNRVERRLQFNDEKTT